MLVGILREAAPGERRAAATPESVRKLLALPAEVAVETGAGEAAGYPDAVFTAAGATVLDGATVRRTADLVLKVTAPTDGELSELKRGATLVSFIRPATNAALVQKLAAAGVSALAMDAVPRITRAQKLDALSSMGNLSGYRAIVEAASAYGGFFTGQVTAAGKLPPAKVLVIGAGVAGLAAIGAARGLGAVVRAFDTRLAAKEQVQSLGAEFLELTFAEDGSGEGGYAKTMSDEFIKAEMALFAAQAKEVDIIVTTALIPGKPAPKLITSEMVRSMRPGSVVVDLAAEMGGNCALTEPGRSVVAHGVTIIGFTDLASRMARTASQLYAQNLVHLASDLVKDGKLALDLKDEVVRGMLVTHGGEVMWPPPKAAQATAQDGKAAATGKAAASAPIGAPQKSAAPPPAKKKGAGHGHGLEKAAPPGSPRAVILALAVSGITLAAIGRVAPPEFLAHLTVFVLACFIGWQVVWNVTPALHTPLMSVTNAISGIIVIGAVLQLGIGEGQSLALSHILAAIAVLVATVNVAGGFLVTQRMLKMFRK